MERRLRTTFPICLPLGFTEQPWAEIPAKYKDTVSVFTGKEGKQRMDVYREQEVSASMLLIILKQELTEKQEEY